MSRNPSPLGRTPAALLLLLVLAACATTAEKRPPTHWASYLAATAEVYGSLEVKANLAFLGQLSAGNPTLEDLVRRTERAFFSLSFFKKPQAEYRILALGNYPAGWLGLYLDWQKDFKKYPAPPSQWIYRDNIYIYQPENGAVLAGGLPFQAQTTSQPPPLEAVTASQLEGHELFLYMPNPTHILVSPGLGNALAVQSLSGFFKAGSQGWTGEAVALLADERSGRVAGLGLKMLLGGWSRTTEDPQVKTMLEKIVLKTEGSKIILQNLEIPFSLAVARLKPLLEVNP